MTVATRHNLPPFAPMGGILGNAPVRPPDAASMAGPCQCPELRCPMYGHRVYEARHVRLKGEIVRLSIGYDGTGRRPLEIIYHAGFRPGSCDDALMLEMCLAMTGELVADHARAQRRKGSTGARRPRARAADSVVLSPRLVKSWRRIARRTKRVAVRQAGMEPVSLLGVLVDEIIRPPAWLRPDDDGRPSEEHHADGGSPQGSRAASVAPDGTKDPSGRPAREHGGQPKNRGQAGMVMHCLPDDVKTQPADDCPHNREERS